MTGNKAETVGPMTILTAKAAAKVCGMSERAIMDALRRGPDSGGLEGRNMRGRKGWVTTRGALQRWIEGGNAKEEEV